VLTNSHPARQDERHDSHFCSITSLSRREQVKDLVEHAVDSFGRVDAIINNAGLMPLSPLEALRVVSPRTAQTVSEEFTELPRRLLLGNRASAKLRSEVPKEQR
jgi:NAD(P)-dependent dehydrogenase (short-subunit alcohol dehydrogenase family)